MPDIKKDKYNIIVNTLVNKGTFSISELEDKYVFYQLPLSRSGILKKLKELTGRGILKKTAEKGSLVRYKLVVSDEAVVFLFEYVDEINIKKLASVWGVEISSAKKYIKTFVDDGIVEKIGTPPREITYVSAENKFDDIFSEEQKHTINKYYSYITPDGRILIGTKGFVYWAENKSNRKDIKQLAQEYLETRKKYYGDVDKIEMIDSTDKLEYVFGKNVY